MKKRIANLGIAWLLAVGVATAASAQEQKTVEIGWAAWSSNEMTTKILAYVLEEKMGQNVELTLTDIAPLYQGVAEGDVDVMTVVWLPITHADYYKRVNQEVIDLGFIYTRARLGWVVPDYIPKDKLNSIEDLKNPEIREKLNATITGIDPGAGLTRLSKKVLKDYDLGEYNLLISSGAGMTAALDRAIKRDEWIVVTGWSPHWKFGAYDLRYLEDPKNVLGGFERVHVIARKGFYQDNIEAASMIDRVRIPIGDLQKAMYRARETSYEQAAKEYVESHPKLVHYWVTGEIE